MRHARWVLLVLALSPPLLGACDRRTTIDAPPPMATGAFPPVAVPALPPSVVDAPISIDLVELRRALEAAVPRTFGNMEERIQHPSNSRQEFAFAAERTPFQVALRADTLSLETVVAYEVRGWYDASLMPDISASCGTSGERPRLRVRLSSPIGLTSDWRFRTRSAVTRLAPYSDAERDACRVSIFNIDVTDRIEAALGTVLEKQLPQVDARIAEWNIRERLDRWYNQMNRPIHVADSLWLLLQPATVRVGDIGINDTALLVNVRLFANPVLLSGAEPTRQHTPLPPLAPPQGEVGDSARVLLQAVLGYDVLAAVLRERLADREYAAALGTVEVQDVRISALGDGRLAVGLRFDGTLRGEGWLVGTPQLDPGSGALVVPDLDFDVGTGNLLVQGLEFLRSPSVLQALRAAAVFPLDARLESLRRTVEDAINRELTDGVTLSATLVRGRLVDVLVTEQALVVRAEAAGRLALDVDRELRIRPE